MGLANYTLNIFSSLGVLVDQFYVNKEYQRIDLSKYSTGLYLIEYRSNFDSNTFNIKFFVE